MKPLLFSFFSALCGSRKLDTFQVQVCLSGFWTSFWAARSLTRTEGRAAALHHIWILVKCDIACDIASLRYLSDISCDIFFIAFAISFISYAITNNIAYDIALRYRMRYPYDAISFISHAISHYDIVCDIFAIACNTALRYRMRYPYDAISHAMSLVISS